MESGGDAKQVEGKTDRAKGNVKDAIGHTKRNVENAIDDMTD